MADTIARLNSALAGRYRVERQLGEGGMATVYLAEDVKHRRSVALKVLKPDLAASVGGDRFLREIELTANLQHPNILPLHDSGEADGLLYFVAPYVREDSLRERLDVQGRLPIEEVVVILREVADALAYAHEHGIIHRDIKPSNVLLSGRGHVIVSDFGIAKAVSGARQAAAITSAGVYLGTLAYMAPEQATGEPVDHRSDLYSLGAMAYELLTGRPPFTGDSPRAVLAAQLTRSPEPVGKLRPEVPPTLADAIMRCLEKDPKDRWQSADELLHALAAVPAAGATSQGSAPGRGRRRRLLWAGAAVAAVAVMAVAGWFRFRPGASGTGRPRIVAVVPLTTIGADDSTRVFAAGLVDILASRMTQLARFAKTPTWVIPPNEIRDLHITSAAKARKELNADLAVTGTMQVLAGGIRLTLDLIDTKTLRQLQATVMSAPLSDLATWQDKAVAQALAMLDVRPEPGGEFSAAPEGGTQSAGAYQQYVEARGRLQSSQQSDQDIDAATKLFERALAEDSLYALAWAGLGEAQWRKYQETLDSQWVNLAIKSSRRALSLTDSLPQVWTTLALIDNGMGRAQEALSNARRAIGLDSLYSAAYLQLGTAYQSLQRFDEAERTLQELIDRHPYYWRAYASFAYLRYTQGRYAEAADLYDRAAKLAPGNAAMYRNAGAIYFFLDRWTEARTMFERSVAVEKNPSSLSNLGALDYYEGHFDSAAERFRQAIQLQTRNYVYWRNLGDAYRQIAGREADARSAYERSLQLGQDELRVNPSDLTVLQNMAFVQAALGHDQAALALVDRIEPQVGDDADLMFSLAQTLEEVGQRDRALGWLREALARGYSLEIVEGEPQLAALRRDPRFPPMVALRRAQDTVKH